MQQETPLQLPNQMSPSKLSCPKSNLDPTCEAEAQLPKPQHEATPSQQALEQQVAKEKPEPHRIPRLRALVESQAFRNILVDEMDMMMSRAATLIQANWRGYQLRQKLVSQMMAAKSIQEAWRRFSNKRILRSNKRPEKNGDEDKDIPYHPPQQVRFQQQYLEGQEPLPQSLPPPVMVNKETQYPSSDSLAPCAPQQAMQKSPATLGSLEPCITTSYVLGAPSVTFLPHQTVAIGFPCPMHVDSKSQYPCLLTKTIRSSCLVHIEGDTMKDRYVITRPSKVGTAEPAPCRKCAQVGPLKTQTQVRVEGEAPRPPPQVCLIPTTAKRPPRTHTTVAMTKVPSQTCPAVATTKISPQTRTAVMMNKMPRQTCLMPPMYKTFSQKCPGAATTYFPPQTCPAATTCKTPPQTRPADTMTRTPPQTHSVAAITKIPSETCPVSKTPPQARLAAIITRTPAQIRSVATLLKTFCLSPTPTGKAPQTSVASGIPQSLSHTQLNPTKVKATSTEKQSDVTLQASSHSYMVAGKARCLPQEVGVPKAPARPHWEAEKIKVCPQRQMKAEVASQTNVSMGVTRTLSWAKEVGDRSKTGAQTQEKMEPVGVQPQACPPVEVVMTPCQALSATTLAKTQCQGHLSTGLAKTLSRTLSKTLFQAQLVTGLTKPQCQAQMPANLAQAQTQQVAKLTKAQTQAGLAKTQSQAQLSGQQVAKLTDTPSQAPISTRMTKNQSQAQQVARLTNTQVQQQTPTGGTKVQVQAQIPPGMTKGQAQAQLVTGLTKSQFQGQTPTALTKGQSLAQQVAELSRTQFQRKMPTGLTRTLSQAQLAAKLTKAQFQAQTPAELTKTDLQAQQVARLTKTLSQARLVTETAKPLCPVQQATDLRKTQSKPQPAGCKAAAQPCQHLCALEPLPQAKPDDKLTQFLDCSLTLGKSAQGSHPQGPETQSMLVPLLASHSSCNIESWGDSGATGTPSPAHSQPVLCPEEAVASQLASLCAELTAMLGSHEDLRSLLCKALSQGEVRATLSQVLSKEVLSTTVSKALPQGMLGAALAKVLSWSELGVIMSRTLSRADLRAELARALQGRLADVLGKALTEDERAVLSQALSQGELGTVLSTSLSQVSLRTAAVLPKAALKVVGSGLTAGPGTVEVDCRGTPSAMWRPTMGPTSMHPSKVRVPCNVAWEEMGDGAVLVGSPCLLGASMGGTLTSRAFTTIHQCSLILGLNPQAPWEGGAGSDIFSLHLSQAARGDKTFAFSGTGPDLPELPHLRPPPNLWPPLIANGVGPSASRPSVTSNTVPSSHKPHVVSRVAPHAWSSPRVGRGFSGRPPNSVGSGRAARFHQSPVTCSGSACWCQLSESSRAPAGMYRSSMARVLVHGSQPPNHKQACMGPRDLPSKDTSSPPLAVMTSKMACTDPQAAHSLLPGSVAPKKQKYLVTQVNPKLSQAPLGLSHTSMPVQEGTQTWVSVSAMPQPQQPATGQHISMFNRLVAPSADIMLAKRFSQSSVVLSNSQSSLKTTSSASLSTTSMISLNAVDLVEESWEGSLEGDLQMSPLLPGKVAGCSQRPGEMEEASRTHSEHMPSSPCHSVAATELVPILHHRPVANRMSFSVHWGSESDTDVSSDPSSTDTFKSLSQVSVRTGLVRSVSLGAVTHALHQQPSQAQTAVANRLASSLSHPTLVSRVAPRLAANKPSLAQSSVAKRVAPSLSYPSSASRVAPSLSQPFVTRGVTPNFSHSFVASGVAPSPMQLSITNNVAPSRPHSSVASGVASNLVQPSAANRVTTSRSHPPAASRMSPSLAQPSVASGVASNLLQPSAVTRMAPNLAHSSVANKVAPSLSHPNAASGVASSLAQPSAANRVAPSLSHPSAVSRVAPSLAQPSTANRVAPSISHPSAASGVAPSLAQPSAANRVAPSLSHPSAVSRVAPSLAQPSTANRVAPSISHPSAASGVAPSLAQPSAVSRVTPSLAHPSAVSRVAPSPAQPSAVSRVTPSLAHPSAASGVAPSLAQPSAANRVAPNLSHPSAASGVAPSLAQPSAGNRVTPTLSHPSAASGVAPSLAQPSVANRVAPSLSHPSTASGVAPSLAQPSATNRMAPSLSYPSVASGVAPSLAQPSVANRMAPSLSYPSVASGVAPSLAQPSVANRMAPSLSYPSAASGVAPSLAQPSTANRMAPSLSYPSAASGVAPSLAQPSTVSRVAPSLSYPSVVGGVALSLAQPSAVSRVAPSLSHPSTASGVAPSLAQPSTANRVTPSLSHPSTASGVAPSLAQPSAANRVTPSLSHPSAASGVAPSLARPSTVNRVTPSLSHPTAVSRVASSLAQPSAVSRVAPSLSHPSTASGVAPSLAQPSAANRMTPSLVQASVANRVTSSLSHPSAVTGAAPSIASVARRVAPSISQASVNSRADLYLVQSSAANMVAPSLASVARRVAPSVSQPSVPSGMSYGLDQPNLASRIDSSGHTSRVNGVTPNLHQPSVVLGATPSKPYPYAANVGRAQSQPSPETWVDPTQNPLIGSGLAFSFQHSKFSEGCRSVSQSSPVTVSAFNLSQASVANSMATGLDQEISASQENLYTEMAPSMSQGNVIAGTAPSMSQGAMVTGVAPSMSQGAMATRVAPSMSWGAMATTMTPHMSQRSVATGIGQSQPHMAGSVAPIASWGAGVPLTHEQASVTPSFSQPSLSNRLAESLSKDSLASVRPSISQLNVDLPVALDYQHPSVAILVTPSYNQANVLMQESMMGTASGLRPGCVASRMTTAMASGTVANAMTSSHATRSVIRGMRQNLPQESVVSSVAQTLPPDSVASGVAQTLPPGSTATPFARTLSPGSAAIQGGKRQGLPLGPIGSMAAPSLPPGSAMSGMDLSVPPGSVATMGASSMAPVSVDEGLNQSLTLGPTASVVTSVPVGSLLIGITPRPYHVSLAGEGSLTPFQASHAASMAQVHPQASETSSITRKSHRGPTILSRVAQMEQAVGMMPFGATENQTMLNPGELDEVSSQVSGSSGESNDLNSKSLVLETIPWMYKEPIEPGMDDDYRPQMEEGTVNESQMPLSGEAATSHAKSVASGVAHTFPSGSIAGGMAPSLPPVSMTGSRTVPLRSRASGVVHAFPSEYVSSNLARAPPPSPVVGGVAPIPSQAPSLTKYPMVGSTTPTLQPRAVASSGIASSPNTMASRVMSPPQGISGVPYDLPMVPQSHSQATTLTTMSRSPQLLRGSSMAPSLPPVSMDQMGPPSHSRWSRTSSMASHMPHQPSSASRAVPSQFQMDTDSGIPLAPEAIGHKKSFRSMHGSIVTEMLDGSLAKLVPPHQLQEKSPQPTQGGPRHSMSTSYPGIIRTSHGAHGTANPRIPPGSRKVSLGYESTPSGSWRPLFDHLSYSSVTPTSSHHPSLIPTVLQGLTVAGVEGGQSWNAAAIPSVVAGPRDCAAGPRSVRQSARGAGPWDATTVDSRRSGELFVSMEDPIIHAVVILQAHVRGYLVRRMIKVWHHSATIIQAVWRGHLVRKQISRMHAAARIIQAQWRRYRARREHYQQMIQLAAQATSGDWSRTSSEHRCFQSCQPRSCAFCQTLSLGLGSPPSVVLLVGSSPRTCHMCGQTMPTRVVQGTGQAAGGWEGALSRKSHGAQQTPCSPRLPHHHHHHRAATSIQSAWRGFLTRRHLRQQQGAAKKVQASWRGHFTRTCLTDDALLSPGMSWESPRCMKWPGV